MLLCLVSWVNIIFIVVLAIRLDLGFGIVVFTSIIQMVSGFISSFIYIDPNIGARTQSEKFIVAFCASYVLVIVVVLVVALFKDGLSDFFEPVFSMLRVHAGFLSFGKYAEMRAYTVVCILFLSIAWICALIASTILPDKLFVLQLNANVDIKLAVLLFSMVQIFIFVFVLVLTLFI